LFAVFVVLLIASHAPLLRLPYFWDEAGYYIPAARDLLAGSLIPHSTPSNAHPPLVMAWLALCWRIFDDGATVTRCAMLGLAAFSLLGFFRLARAVSNSTVAAVSTFLTAIYPVFFAQSSLAQVDLAAAGLCFWGLETYVRRRGIATAIWFSLAALAKETAILVSLALCGWEVALFVFDRERFSFVDRPLNDDKPPRTRRDTKETLGQLLVPLLPIVPLALWYGYHYARTGFVFGNPEFFRYNLQGNFHVLRIVLAFLLRIWQTIGYLNLYVLTAACILAMMYPPLPELSPAAKQEKTAGSKLRQRIPVAIQFAFVAIAIVYIVALSIVGGAVLARYMLPIVPLIILTCVSTVWRRLRAWKAVLCVVAAAFIGALFVNPPYGFSPEDNLAYRDYIRLHERAEAVIVGRYPRARVLTAWPASDELSRPNLGYVARPIQVVRIEDFTAEQLLAAADEESRFDVALVFSTKYQAPLTPFDRWRRWQEWKTRYFGYHVDLGPETAASVLRGNLVYLERRKGQWVSVIEIQKIEEAKLAGPPISVSRPTYTASK
jgi:nitrate reductase NapE component